MASATVSKGTFQPDSDVHITFEDQQKINKFARLNARVDEYRDELKSKQNTELLARWHRAIPRKEKAGVVCELHFKENDILLLDETILNVGTVNTIKRIRLILKAGTTLKNLEDATEELMLLDEDDCPNLPYLSGETFVYYNLLTAQINLEELKKTVEKEMKDIGTKIKDISSTMSDLKSHLYGKFGNNINLEAED